MKKELISCDLDDVILDFIGGVLKSIKLEFGHEISFSTMTSWEKHPLADFDWKSYGYSSWWSWMEYHNWLWATFAPVEGALGGLAALQKSGYDIELITSKPKWASSQVYRWLARHRLALRRVAIVNDEEPKHVYTDTKILIDDKPKTIQTWIRSDPERYAILFCRPWNCNIYPESRLFVASTWKNIPACIRAIEEHRKWAQQKKDHIESSARIGQETVPSFAQVPFEIEMDNTDEIPF
mgnify:CR=1 FL=1